MSKCVYLASMGVKIEHSVGVQNKDFFFQNAYLMVMSTETLATTKVKIAKMYALVRRNLNDIHGKLDKIEFSYKFCCTWPLGRLAAIIIDILDSSNIFGLIVLSNKRLCNIQLITCWRGERGGSVVECRTPEREVRGSKPTTAVLCPWARHFTPRKYWLLTQEAMAPSRYDWKIVDWDVKPQHNQTTNQPTCWRLTLRTSKFIHF